MKPEEIRKLVDFNNNQIMKAMMPNIFVLQPKVQDLLNHNKELQEQCDHTYLNGFCIYCDKEVEDTTWQED